MCDGVSKNVGFLQGRTVDIDEKWGNGRRKLHTTNGYLLQDLGKTVSPTDPSEPRKSVSIYSLAQTEIHHPKVSRGSSINCGHVDCGLELLKDRQRFSERSLDLTANIKFYPINLRGFFFNSVPKDSLWPVFHGFA